MPVINRTSLPDMNKPACPMCEMPEVLEQAEQWECVTCGHEWPREAENPEARVVKDAFGTVLADGDSVALIKDLKLKGNIRADIKIEVLNVTNTVKTRGPETRTGTAAFGNISTQSGFMRVTQLSFGLKF